MIEASCHCGAVKFEVPNAPESVTDCNCSICRRLGTLWAYYDPAEVVMETPEAALDVYVRQDTNGDLLFRRCRVCGCMVDWRARPDLNAHRMGINARLLDPLVLEGMSVRKFDGAAI